MTIECLVRFISQSLRVSHTLLSPFQRSIRVHAEHNAPVPLPALHRLCETALGRPMHQTALELLLQRVLHLDAKAIVAADEVCACVK
jgi:hypothetical protein